MPVRCTVNGVAAVFKNGRWECESESHLAILEALTNDEFLPSDPEGVEEVERVVGLFSDGEVVKVTEPPESDGDVF